MCRRWSPRSSDVHDSAAKAFADGIPANSRAVPDGAMMAKVEWAKKHEPGPPYAATVPGRLIEVSFMVKDSKRFPGTNGRGYAKFRHESSGWTPFGDSPAFANTCHACHTRVKSRDFVFTEYGQR
ncbi:MAG TPA: cytochrome P460 family protein [Vicinamibacterales bacterium]|nr:cytochrome P460 family protein [Vicinamibacterales bacterium]